jgi:hypothetical protein
MYRRDAQPYSHLFALKKTHGSVSLQKRATSDLIDVALSIGYQIFMV